MSIAFDRDEMVRWYARRHLETDAGVQQVYFLPENSPQNEIRFIEVNHLISETSDPQPIDFGVDIGSDQAHTLYVLDVTPSQWIAIQAGHVQLPNGWTLDRMQKLKDRAS